MIVLVSAEGASSLRDEHTFTSLHVELVGAPRSVAIPNVEPACGVWDPDGDHLWITPDWLRANGPADARWHSGLDRMLDYAASKGWLDSNGRVRAHVARS